MKLSIISPANSFREILESELGEEMVDGRRWASLEEGVSSKTSLFEKKTRGREEGRVKC